MKKVTRYPSKFYLKNIFIFHSSSTFGKVHTISTKWCKTRHTECVTRRFYNLLSITVSRCSYSPLYLSFFLSRTKMLHDKEENTSGQKVLAKGSLSATFDFVSDPFFSTHKN